MPSNLPAGTVTFLFSDIEGSTRLLQRLGPDYARVLGEHQALLRAAWAAHGGIEMDTAGDGFFVAFPTAPAAVAAAAEATRALAENPWPEGAAVRVRIGLHSGAPTLVGAHYVGLDVHRAARIAAAGHGGQVLLSEASRALAEHELPEGASLRDLGAHRLKDLQHAEHLYQMVLERLPADFAPLKTLDARPHNLPVQPTPLLGREVVLGAVCALLRREGARLVTLTGPGGIGKTRLSIQVVAEVLDDFPDGVWFVRLSRLTDPGLVLPTVAQTLGVPEQGGKATAETLRTHLRDKRLLLVLDNLEQVIGAAPAVGALLEASPGLKVLVTSRIRLHLRGEREFPLTPLPLPEPGDMTPPEQLSQYAAVALFVERAREARPEFTMTAANAPAIAEICARLDGLPLAIELAAARVKVLPPEALLARLSGRLALLTGGARDLEERQRTMRAAIAWSEDLLGPDERTLFRRLAVFVGGCTLEAAEAVCAAPEGDETLGIDVLEGLTALVEQSLVQQREEAGEARFSMLHVIRDYALERLEASGEVATVKRAHLTFMRGLGQAFYRDYYAVTSLQAVDTVDEWHDRLEREHDNLRAALTWARTCATDATRSDRTGGARATGTGTESELEAGLDLVGTLLWFWAMRGHLDEGRQWSEALLALDVSEAATRSGAGTLLEVEPSGGRDTPGDVSPTLAWVVRARAWYAQGVLAYWQGDAREAIAPLERSASLYRGTDVHWGLMVALNNLGMALRSCGDLERAEALFEESLAIARATQPMGERMILINLAELALDAGDLDLAQVRSEESLALRNRWGDPLQDAFSLTSQAVVACRRGQPERAAPLARKVQELYRRGGDARHFANGLEICAIVLAARGKGVQAARLLGAAAAHRERIGMRGPMELPTQRDIEAGVAQARAKLGAKRWATAIAAGRALSLDEATTEALKVSPRSAELPAALAHIVDPHE